MRDYQNLQGQKLNPGLTRHTVKLIHTAHRVCCIIGIYMHGPTCKQLHTVLRMLCKKQGKKAKSGTVEKKERYVGVMLTQC